jgi:hypothetical protein
MGLFQDLMAKIFHPLPAVPAGDSGESLASEDVPTVKRWPYQVVTLGDWSEHQQEVVLVPDGGVVQGDSRGRSGAVGTR